MGECRLGAAIQVGPMQLRRSRLNLLFRRLVLPIISIAIAWMLVPTVDALAPTDFPAERPAMQVLDDADVLSRSSRSELDQRLEAFGGTRVDARLVTLRRLDYGFSLNRFGEELIERWNDGQEGDPPLLLLLIETQNKRASVVADPSLSTQLPDSLLTSTGRTTMAVPLREGDRYRQASLDGLTRLSVVLEGGEDPGPPVEIVKTTLPTNIPTQEETESSNATTWIIVLLVLGSIIPMATWWVFSR